MRNNDTYVYLASLKNITNKLEVIGQANLTKINLLKMIYKYCTYCENYSQIQAMDQMVMNLQRSDKDICSQTTFNQLYPDGIQSPTVIIIGTSDENTGPSITGNSIVFETETFTFSNEDFYVGWTDPEGDEPAEIVIKTLPAQGTLAYDMGVVSIGDVISDASLLVYTRNVNTEYVSEFEFTVYDNNDQLPLESNQAIMGITAQEYIVPDTNEPPTVGDRDKYSGNRVTTVFSSADFTTEAVLPYEDPEGNPLQAIRIVEIAESNDGVFYYLGSVLTENQIITKDELDSGALYHIGADKNSINTDSFRCAIRDSVDGEWVE
jgi:hypothetical protein